MRPPYEGGGQEPALQAISSSPKGSGRACAVPGAQVLGLRQPAVWLRSLQRSGESFVVLLSPFC